MITLVKFFADWCGPCSLTVPYVNLIRDKYEDVVITEVDIDANPQMRVDHHVTQIPTFLIFKDGMEVGRRQGVANSDDLENWVNEFRGVQPDVLQEPSGGSEGSSDTVLSGSGEQKDQ